MRSLPDGLNPATLLQHFAEEEKILGAVSPPIFQTSTFAFESVHDLQSAMVENPQGPPHHYSRVGNPGLDAASNKIAMMEGTERCVLLGSGMGAIAIAILSNASAGSHIVCVDTCYGPLRAMLIEYMSRLGVTHTFVEGSCPDEVLEAIRPETTLVYLESPSTGVFRLQDLETIGRVCRERGVTTAIDNTYATPVFQQPMRFGIDLVVHSCSKYLGGHSDITAGAICSSRERIDRIVRQDVNFLGSILHPFQAWLLLRGMRTVRLRLRAHEDAANAIAAKLENHPSVDRVHHVGSKTYRQNDLFRKQMTGSGGLFSFEPKNQDPEAVRRFCGALKLFQIGVSWGGFESLVVALHFKPMDYPEARWVIRLYVGLEDPGDLMRDIEQAFQESGL